MNAIVPVLSTADGDFDAAFTRLLARTRNVDCSVTDAVRAIVDAVRTDGDAALIAYARDLDGSTAATAAELEVAPAAIAAATAALPAAVHAALTTTAERVRDFHRHELANAAADWQHTDADGGSIGQRTTAIARAGIYVPGGTAAYPSTVLMGVIPARVAGVGEVCIAAPNPGTAVLAAAAIAGVDRVFAIGGAHAIAALAYGTASVPAVDLIAGPGNVYVAAAKRMVFGDVGVDMVAGPSEVVVVADAAADPQRAALDLCAQAEHDERAQAVLLSDDAALTEKVQAAIADVLPTFPRRDIITAALAAQGALINVRDLSEAMTLANRIAPEHLQLMTAAPEELLPQVHNAGAIFIGGDSAEVLGDYCAGPNHILPTAGSARFASPLSVATFRKRTNIVHCTAATAAQLSGTAAVLAECEGLDAHAAAARARQ